MICQPTVPWSSSWASVLSHGHLSLFAQGRSWTGSVRGGSPGGPLLMCETSRPLWFAQVLHCWLLRTAVWWCRSSSGLCCICSSWPIHPVGRILKINKDMIDILLVLAVFITQNTDVEDLFCGTSPTKTSLLFGYDLLCLWCKSIQNDFQHLFARMADEADGSVVLTQLQISFLGECDDELLSPRCWPFSNPPDLIADVGEHVGHCLPSMLYQFCWDVVYSSSFTILQCSCSCLYFLA